MFVIDYYSRFLPEAKIILIEDGAHTDLPTASKHHIRIDGLDQDLFNRSFLLNKGSQYSNASHYLLADTDCVPEVRVLENIWDTIAQYGDKYVVLHSRVYYLNPGASVDFVFCDKVNDGQIPNDYHTTAVTVGGVTLCSADLFHSMNGFDQQRFLGWGGEDDDFYNRCYVKGLTTRIDSNLLHLHHPPVDGGAFSKKAVPFTEEQIAYKKAKIPPVQLRPLSERVSMSKEFIQKNKIGLATCSSNNALLDMSKQFYEDIFDDVYVVDGSKGVYGFDAFVQMLTDPRLEVYDYLLYTDEDNFIVGWHSMRDTLQTFIDGDYGFAGMPDGGVISHRFHNPVAINPFLSIFNLKQIRQLDLSNIVGRYKSTFKTPDHLIKTWDGLIESPREKIVVEEGYTPYGISYDEFEPYYKLWFYMLDNGLTCLYLDAYDAYDMDNDGCCTELIGIDGDTLSYHTWFARSYNNSPERINAVYKKASKRLRI